MRERGRRDQQGEQFLLRGGSPVAPDQSDNSPRFLALFAQLVARAGRFHPNSLPLGRVSRLSCKSQRVPRLKVKREQLQLHRGKTEPPPVHLRPGCAPNRASSCADVEGWRDIRFPTGIRTPLTAQYLVVQVEPRRDLSVAETAPVPSAGVSARLAGRGTFPFSTQDQDLLVKDCCVYCLYVLQSPRDFPSIPSIHHSRLRGEDWQQARKSATVPTQPFPSLSNTGSTHSSS